MRNKPEVFEVIGYFRTKKLAQYDADRLRNAGYHARVAKTVVGAGTQVKT